MPSFFHFYSIMRSFLHDEFSLTVKIWKYIIKSPNLKKEGKIMDRKEIKAKIMKAITIALPILLVAILAVLIVVAMDFGDENAIPVFNDDGWDTTSSNVAGNGSTTSGNQDNEDPQDPDDEPTPDPSSQGLSFSSNGDGTCAIDGLGDCTDVFIIIPSMSPDGDIVVEIADNAFKNCNKIKGVEFSDTVKRIGSYAFYGSNIREITIPSTIKEIGNYAFAGCKYLEEIEVDDGNANYSSSSGVLYSKDGERLITYPAGKTANFVVISRDVTEIANMAFYKCTSIKKVTYHGTSASWKSVEIGAGNDVIEEAVIYCAGDGSK